MIDKIIGIIWIIFGLFWLLRPQSLMRFFSKKIKKQRFKLFFLFLLLFGSPALSFFFKAYIFWLKVLIVIGFIILIKLFLSISQKAGDKINNYLLCIPLIYYRIFSLGVVIVGFIFLKVI